jgi:GT2 family glycosyltransferase
MIITEKVPVFERGITDQRASTPFERARVDGKLLLRGNRRLRLHGATYGPFALNEDGQPFPTPARVEEDFARMRDAGINSIRTYHLPPDWLLRLATEQQTGVLVDVPWRKHLCFLESREARQEARQFVAQAAKRGQAHPCILAYSIANEIPPNIIRWYGARRVEQFLAELKDVCKQADPRGLVTYANYPPTEYLDLSFLDFVTFNVYLHDPETFRRYLVRLQNLTGDRPLVLGEIGMDTLRHGEEEQARFLTGHTAEALRMGLAGVFLFSWTDEWHTGGHAIQDWAFGITHADRRPKASYHALREVFEQPVASLLPETPRVSVVVCTYNGGRTLRQCLCSLLGLDYPDYEIIVVDDGSTDDTQTIVADFPEIKVIRQANHGLSVARNVGLQAASGTIIAYTDSDCFADADWLTHLVYQFQRSGAAAVGGPNLTPEDGRLAACVAASPGQPTHVLESDQVAEHIPGCNMAFRREALAAINGFDAQYRKAGDDVDVCWRLQQAGYWITFAPGAFVWHHRRQNPRAYLRQQAGYGEAEALLRFKHPDKFNGRGDGKWRGVLYGASLRGLCLDGALIYRGTFSTGLFQCLYQPAPAHWAMLPSTLEWHAGVALVAVLGFLWPMAWLIAAGLLALSFVVAALQAAQARPAPEHDGAGSRLLITVLCYLQPLVRSWKRYRTRLFSYRPPEPASTIAADGVLLLPWSGHCVVNYWSEAGRERIDLLTRVIAYLNEHGWGRVIDGGWSDWDLQVYCHPWTFIEVCTAQEDHAEGKRLIRVRYRLRPSGYIKFLGLTALALAAIAAALASWMTGAAAAGVAGLAVGLWWRGRHRAGRAAAVIHAAALRLGLARCDHHAGQ